MKTAADVAQTVADAFLGAPVSRIVPIIGKGIVNLIFVADAGGARVVVRMREDTAAEDYAKEAWCLARAAERGIAGPTVLARGRHGPFSYMIQSFVTGDNGEDSAVAKDQIWREIGRYARLLHGIPVSGFGLRLADPSSGRFDEGFASTWADHVGYNLQSLTADDPLIALGVYTHDKQPVLRGWFEELRERAFTFGLCHGDLSLKNAVVTDAGHVSLLDWGSARVHIVPHYDIIHMRRDPASGCDLPGFLAGYGLTPDEYARMEPELDSLLVLSAVDTLRWALDNVPARAAKYVAAAQAALAHKSAAASFPRQAPVAQGSDAEKQSPYGAAVRSS